MRSDINKSPFLIHFPELSTIESSAAKILPNVENPPGSLALGGFCAARRYLLRFAHPHTHTGLQLQQQRSVVVVLGIIVIADLLYRVPAKLA
jgi:hypothetical protein